MQPADSNIHRAVEKKPEDSKVVSEQDSQSRIVCATETTTAKTFQDTHPELFKRAEVWQLCADIARHQSEIYQSELSPPNTIAGRLGRWLSGASSAEPKLLETVYVPGQKLAEVAGKIFPTLAGEARNRATAAVLEELYATGLVEPVTRAGGYSNAEYLSQVIGVRIKSHDLFAAARNYSPGR